MRWTIYKTKTTSIKNLQLNIQCIDVAFHNNYHLFNIVLIIITRTIKMKMKLWFFIPQKFQNCLQLSSLFLDARENYNCWNQGRILWGTFFWGWMQAELREIGILYCKFWYLFALQSAVYPFQSYHFKSIFIVTAVIFRFCLKYHPFCFNSINFFYNYLILYFFEYV